MSDAREIRWDEETDVVVLGCGGAGAVAAITARDAGAQVVIVEKGEAGGNTKLATNAFVCPTDNAAARAHIKALSLGLVSEEIIDAYVQWTAQNIDYIKQLGGEVESCFPPVVSPGYGSRNHASFPRQRQTPQRAGWDISLQSSLQ